MAVFFSEMDEDPEDEDLTEPSEMYVYARYYTFASTKIAYSDKQEEQKIFAETMKLVPFFKDLIIACYRHR